MGSGGELLRGLSKSGAAGIPDRAMALSSLEWAFVLLNISVQRHRKTVGSRQLLWALEH